MGQIIERLERIMAVKDDIRAALRRKGVNVDAQTAFEVYPSLIDGISDVEGLLILNDSSYDVNVTYTPKSSTGMGAVPANRTISTREFLLINTPTGLIETEANGKSYNFNGLSDGESGRIVTLTDKQYNGITVTPIEESLPEPEPLPLEYETEEGGVEAEPAPYEEQ